MTESTASTQAAGESAKGEGTAGASALADVIRCLRAEGRFVDDEGEATNRLGDLLASLLVWRPIATAPKDGTVLRLFCEGFIDPDFNPSGSVEGFWLDGIGWVGAVWDGYRDCWDTREDIQPSRWMPLPAPPASSTDSLPSTPAEGSTP